MPLRDDYGCDGPKTIEGRECVPAAWRHHHSPLRTCTDATSLDASEARWLEKSYLAYDLFWQEPDISQQPYNRLVKLRGPLLCRHRVRPSDKPQNNDVSQNRQYALEALSPAHLLKRREVRGAGRHPLEVSLFRFVLNQYGLAPETQPERSAPPPSDAQDGSIWEGKAIVADQSVGAAASLGSGRIF